MSRWLPERKQHQLWLGPHGGATRSRSGFGAFAEPVGFGGVAEAGSAPRADALFADWCAQHPNSACELVLSGHLVHSLRLAEAAQRTSIARLQSDARQHWARFHGAAAMHWPVAVDASEAAGIACAPDGIDLTACLAAARRHGVCLVSVRPAWPSAWAAASKGTAPAELRMALFEPGLVTWLGVSGGRCVAIERQRIDDADGHDEARRRTLLKQAPMSNIDAPWLVIDAAPSFDSASTRAAVPAPDFMAEAARPGWSAWGLLAAGVAALAAGALDARALAGRIDAQRERVASIERAATRRLPIVRLATEGAASTAGDDARARSAQDIAERLRHPWPALFGAVEQATAGGAVQLLSFAHEVGRGGGGGAGDALRVEGVATSDEALTAFVRTLADSPALQGVALRRQQPVTDRLASTAAPVSTPGLRFEVGAALP